RRKALIADPRAISKQIIRSMPPQWSARSHIAVEPSSFFREASIVVGFEYVGETSMKVGATNLPTGTTAYRTVVLTTLAMIAFAANSVLCRIALSRAAIDPASFTLLRLASGVCMLWLIRPTTRTPKTTLGSWPASVALFAYAAAFSFAYI